MKQIIKKIKKELDYLTSLNSHCFLVGGCVRDYLLGEEPKDIDVEVYGISYGELGEHLSNFGKVDFVGKKFGVIKYNNSYGEFDFSIPRRETKVGIGHTGFEIDFEDVSINEAFGRRDFTINAIGYDYVNDKYIDLYGGIKDLNNRILRHTTSHFSEDPLRVLRAMQLQCRLGFEITQGTKYLMSEMIEQELLGTLPIERIAEEFKKWAVKGKYHYMIFDFLRETGMCKFYPELIKLDECQQDVKYHPEGNAEVHTKLVLKEALQICMRNKLNDEDKEILIYSALLHDIAKPEYTVKKTVNEMVRITSHGHEQAGVELSEKIMKRMGVVQSVIDKVKNIICNHMQHVNFRNIDKNNNQYVAKTNEGKGNYTRGLKSTVGTKIKFLRKLSDKLSPATIEQLMRLIEADLSGRHPLPKSYNDDTINEMLDISREINVNTGNKFEKIINGFHLIELGFKQGKVFREILNDCAEAQIDGKFNDVESGKDWILKNWIVYKDVPIKNKFKYMKFYLKKNK